VRLRSSTSRRHIIFAPLDQHPGGKAGENACQPGNQRRHLFGVFDRPVANEGMKRPVQQWKIPSCLKIQFPGFLHAKNAWTLGPKIEKHWYFVGRTRIEKPSVPILRIEQPSVGEEHPPGGIRGRNRASGKRPRCLDLVEAHIDRNHTQKEIAVID